MLLVVSKRLVILRHAKSSWNQPGLSDHERPLNGRGRRAATRMGRYLRAEGITVDLVLCSSATRTRETLDRLDLAPGPNVRLEDGLYGATAAAWIERLHAVADDVGAVLIIGHNPGLQDLVDELLAEVSDRDQVAAFPTAALADLRLPILRWDALGPGIAQLDAFVVPRDLDD